MSTLLGLLGSVGAFLLNLFISDLAKRAAMTRSWNAWIANRQSRADQTIELKMNLDEQTTDLDQKRKELEHPSPPPEGKK